MKRYLIIQMCQAALGLSAIASPVVQEVTVYPFTLVNAHQADLVIEEYVPLDAKRPGKKWTFKNPNVSKRTVWRVTADPNTVFNAWLDENGNGNYDIGEPFGTSAGRDYPEIELTFISPITPRIDLVTQTSDRALTFDEIKSNIVAEAWSHQYTDTPTQFSNRLERIIWVYSNRLERAEIKASTRIRVVRWLISGSTGFLVPCYRAGTNMRVVLDKTIEIGARSCLTETDFLVGDENVFDLEWNDLYREVVDNTGVLSSVGNVTEVSYLVVVGDGPAEWDNFSKFNQTVRAISQVIKRRYPLSRPKPIPRSPIVNRLSVTLTWRIDAPEIEGFTAYRAKILSGSTEIHDTGLFRNPARWDDGSFHWTITNSIPPGTYNWMIAAYNSKFSNEQSSAYTNGIPFTVTGE